MEGEGARPPPVDSETGMEVEEGKSESGDVTSSSSKSNEAGALGVPVPGLYTDFSLSSTQLFFELKENGLDLVPLSKPIKTNKNEDKGGFEKANPFVTAAIRETQRCRTENFAPTFNTSDDPRIDFFFHVMEQTTPEMAIELLEKSWDRDALDTLKLVGSLRDIKDGKGIRQQYQHSLYWLYVNHPITLYNNLPQLLKLGYWKDALQMLMVVMFDGFVHPYFAFDDGNKKNADSTGASAIPRPRRRGQKRKKDKGAKQTDSEKRIYNTKIAEHYKVLDSFKADKIPSKDMDSLRFRYAREMFNNSEKYRIFHVRIAHIFAQQLADDLTLFNGPDKKKDISLASKWAPNLEGHFDRYTMISTTIALELARIMEQDFLSKSIPTAAYLARKFYKKEVYVPLRVHLCIPENFMSKNDWGNVNYKRVPAKCMQKNKRHFIKHDKERLTAFLAKDINKVAGATLKPIELIRRAMEISARTEEAERLILEKQWTSLVEDIKKKGSLLSGAIAICDVSSSMNGDPMAAAMGLTLLTMEQTLPPWNEICVTFDTNPTLFHLTPSWTLMRKVETLREMPWGGSTNFQATLKLILDLGVMNNLPQDDMPKILFTFTDMEFDEAFPGTTATNFEHAKQLFEAKGYKLPTMVFWNLRANTRKTSTPVQKDENGVILLSGFSGQLLSFIMNQTDLANCTPWNFVKKLIDKEKYELLKVYD